MNVTPKIGGKSPLTVFVKTGSDVVASLFPIHESSDNSTLGLRGLILEQYDGAYDVELIHEPPAPAPELVADLERAVSTSDGSHPNEASRVMTRLIAAEPDVAVFSLSSDLTTPPDDFRVAISRVVKLVKEASDARIIFFNCSSVDPNDTTSNYRQTPDAPSLQVHRLNRHLLELSALEGISIIDADRVIAELGGREHVQGGLLRYSGAACEALCREFARVLADYGFFERRPILPQVGAGIEAGA